jgi:hypothetical protein
LLDLSKSHTTSSPSPSQVDIDSRVNKIFAESSKVESATPMGQKMFKTDEQSIEQLHKEIVQALRHLEQVEIDKDY